MKSYKRVFYFSISIVLVSCTTTQPTYKRIDPSSKTSIASEIPTDIFGDSARIRSFEIFPSSVAQSLDTIVNKGGINKNSLREVKGLFCDGNKAKVTSTFNVKVIPPKASGGITLDQAMASKKKFLEYSRYFLKTRFFASATGKRSTRNFIRPVMKDTRLNPDYQSVLADDGLSAKEKVKNQKYFIPVQSNSRKSIEEFYSELPYAPLFSETRWIERWDEPHENIDQAFFSIITGDQSALLVPKASSFIELGWDYDGGPLQPKLLTAAITEHSSTLPRAKSGRAGEPRDQDFMRWHVHVLPSEFGWDVDGLKTAYPLQIGFSKELEFLVSNFTFIFSRETVQKVLSYKNPLVQQHFGVDYFNGAYHQKVAIDDRAFIWDMVLWVSTSLKESPQNDGSVLYLVDLDMSHFCELGVSLPDLQSE